MDDTALEILGRLNECDPSDDKIQEEVGEIKRIAAITGSSKLTVKEFFSTGPHMNRWRATIAFTSQAFQQIGGINLVTYYAT
jgi:hypothetical protein